MVAEPCPATIVPETISIDEACRILGGISRKTLHLLMAENAITCVNRARPGRRHYRRPIKASVLAHAQKMMPVTS